MERDFRINWSDIISKIIFLIIFVLILVWFFPTCSNNDNSKNNDSVLEKYNFSVLFDRIFKDNLNEMKYAAKSYFTKERMPEAGEEKTLTLQEMYDKNLLLPLIDKDNNACDAEKSTVKVTKDGKEYKMKISLTCGEETKSITEVIGCYDFCEDGSCGEKGTITTGLQYQFMREISNTSYSCPKGYTLKGKYCYTETFGDRIPAEEIISEEKTYYEDAKKNTDKEVKIYTQVIPEKGETTYTCPAGYELDGTVCKKDEYTDPIHEKGYTCPTGYTLNGNYCYKTTTISATPEYTYTCPSGYTKSGTTCSKVIESSPVQKLVGYTCPSGCTAKGDGSTCTTKTTKDAKATKKLDYYSCPSGYSKNGSKCTKKVANGYSYGSWKLVSNYSYTYKKSTYTNTTSKLVYTGSSTKKSCSSCRPIRYYHYAYYTRSKTTKYKTTTTSATAHYKTTYSCSGIGGTLSGSKCIITNTKNCTPKYNTVCTLGVLVGNICKQTDTRDADKEITGYTCPTGYTQIGNTCTTSIVIPATEVEGETTCPQGYEKVGETCKKTTTTPATEVPGKITYSCPEGFTLDPSEPSCYRVDKIEGDYYCENSQAELIGKQCKITIPGGEVIGYKCPTGYIRDGKYCYTKVTKKVTATSKTVVSYQYKWSYLKSIPGWTRTGRTRSA